MIIITTDNGPVVVEPDTPAQEKPHFTFTWFGTDGSEWDLVRGPAWLLSGARGFGLPAPQHWLRESPGLDGATWEGLRLPPREVYMPVELESRSDVVGVDRDFFAGLNPRRVGRLRVTTPEGTWREITCRYSEGAEGEYEIDPHLDTRVIYPIRLIATDPYWRGEPVKVTIRKGETSSIFPGPPFTLAPGLSFDNAPIVNPAEEPSYARGRINGPFRGFSVNIGGQSVAMDITKAADEYVEIDMHPNRGTFTDETGADVSDFVTARSATLIPVGESTMSVTFEGDGEATSVDLEFPTPYWRAW